MLTVDRRREGRRTREKREVENDAYCGFLARGIRALGRRIASGDVEDIGKALYLRNLLDAQIAESVRILNGKGESWERIGRGAGITRQAAQQRWGDKGQG